MYDIVDYGLMTADRVRMDAYVEALRRAVTPGSVVVDIGTGTGIFALLACQFGARRVYAIEPDNAIFVAQEMATANGYADRIEFIKELSTRTVLPERADVIISDIRGILPLVQQDISTLIDARRRLLAPGGVLIPQRDTLWATVVETTDQYHDYTMPLEDNVYGLDMRAARNAVVNNWRKARAGQQMLTTPKCWATLDYTSIENPNVRSEVSWPVARKGIGHGYCIWFDTLLAEGTYLTNSPIETQLVYGQAFFPWSEAVSLDVGDTVRAVLQASLVGEDYVWSWNTQILEQGTEQVKANFKQSNFYGTPLGSINLEKREASYLPTLDEDGHLVRQILQLMGEHNSLGDIAHQMRAAFPNRFTEWQDALNYVCELSKQYSH